MKLPQISAPLSLPVPRTSGDDRVAVIGDGENVDAPYLNSIVRVALSLGDLSHFIVMGDLRSPRMENWRKPEMVDAIAARGGFLVDVRSQGIKNSSDHAIVVRASRLFFKGECDTIAIVSNDKGFSQIARQLRGEGARVVGIGTHQPTPVFRAAFSDFFVVRPCNLQAATAPKLLAGVISRIVEGWAFVTVPRVSLVPIACPLTRVGPRLGDVVRLLLRPAAGNGWRGEILETLVH